MPPTGLTGPINPVSRRKHERRDSPQLSVQELIDQVVLVFTNAGIPINHSKISRLVRTYKHRPERNGHHFSDYLINSLALSVMQRSRVVDDLVRVLAYADPTGELATDRAMHHPFPRKDQQ